MLNYKLFAVLAIVLLSGIFYEEAFAAHHSTQPNALASYDSDSKEITISWDFNSLAATDTCYIKGDFNFGDDINTGAPDDDSLNNTGFIPRIYSSISSTPDIITAADNGGYLEYTGELISCNSGFRIDTDTVLDYETNYFDYPYFEAFITFYVVHEGNDFKVSDVHRIDETMIVFDLDNTANTATKNWACNSQIGNVLYVDASGIHGNNGANCDKYETVDSKEWVDIADDGTVTTGVHPDSSFSLLYRVIEQIIAIVTSNGGGDSDAKSKPTFGLDHKTNAQLVEKGLVINGKVHTVDDNFFTHMDMLHLEVGATQNFTSTVYAPHTLHIMEFGFGIPVVGEWDEREASFDIITNYDGDELGVKFHQDEVSPIINATSVEYSVSKVKCNSNDNTAPCYRVSVEFSFMEAPLYNVFGLQAIDNSRKNQILYFNDGITLEGDSQNPPTVQQITSEIKYKGLQTVQRIDRENNIWMTMDKSEPVVLYKQNDHGSFTPIEYRIIEQTPDEVQMNMDRLNSQFKNLIAYEQKRATDYFDARQFDGEAPTFWSYDYPQELDRMVELHEAMKYEVVRAQLEKVLSTQK